MTGEAGWAPAGVDTRRANIARVYDYWLGGSQNFLADQDLARQIVAIEPMAREIARPLQRVPRVGTGQVGSCSPIAANPSGSAIPVGW